MENITESNRLIAEFMGIGFPANESEETEMIESGLEIREEYELIYESSWDWLMPVVEKINDFHVQGMPEIRIGFRTEVFYSPLTEDGATVQKLSKTYPDGSIEYVHKAVVEFITWFNANKEATK